MHFRGKITQLFRDLGHILLDYMRDVTYWGFQDGAESEDDSSDLELKLEVLHETEPVGED